MVNGINVVDPVMHSICWVLNAVDVRMKIRRKNSVIFLNDRNVEMYA